MVAKYKPELADMLSQGAPPEGAMPQQAEPPMEEPPMEQPPMEQTPEFDDQQLPTPDGSNPQLKEAFAKLSQRGPAQPKKRLSPKDAAVERVRSLIRLNNNYPTQLNQVLSEERLDPQAGRSIRGGMPARLFEPGA